MGASLDSLRQSSADEVGALVEGQARALAPPFGPYDSDSAPLAQGKAFAGVKESFVDFGLDGATVLALNEADLKVTSRRPASRSAREICARACGARAAVYRRSRAKWSSTPSEARF